MGQVRKKYNPLKGKEAAARRVAKNIGLAFIYGQPSVSVIQLNTMERLPPTKGIEKAVNEFPWEWAIELSCCCKDWQGKRYITSKKIVAQTPIKHNTPEFLAWLNDQHNEFLSSINKDNIVAPAWLAMPINRELETWEVMEIYSIVGGWDAD